MERIFLQGKIETIFTGDIRLLVVDNSGCALDQMKSLVTDLQRKLIFENRPQRILSIFTAANYLSFSFFSHYRQELKDVVHLIERNAFIGFTPNREDLLMEFNGQMGTDFRSFQTREDAVDYLLF